MKEVKHLRLRSLAAFLVPVLFAVFMMQPAPLTRLISLEETPAVFLWDGKDLTPCRLLPDAALTALLSDRWCVKGDRPEEAANGVIKVSYGSAYLLLMENRQYLILEEDRIFQLPGKTLLPLVSAMLEP